MKINTHILKNIIILLSALLCFNSLFSNNNFHKVKTNCVENRHQFFLKDNTAQFDQIPNKKIKVVIIIVIRKFSYDKNAYYIFVVPNFSDVNINGYMVRGRALGFVNSAATTTDLAHELGHGAFKLEHTFDAIAKGTSNNLMDYSNQTHLTKSQWLNIQNPTSQLTWFDEEEDGSYQGCNPASANLAYGVLQTKLTDCVNNCPENIGYGSNGYCLQRYNLTNYVLDVCSEAIGKLTNQEAYNIILNITYGFNNLTQNIVSSEEQAIIRVLRVFSKSNSGCSFFIQKFEENNFALFKKLRTGIDGDNYDEFIAITSQMFEIARPINENSITNVDEQIFKWNGSNGGINFTSQFNQQGLLSVVVHTDNALGYKNITLNPFNPIGILSKVKLPSVKNGFNGKYYTALVPAIYLQWLYDKGESEGATTLAFAVGSVLTLQGGVGIAINSSNTLIKVFGILEATSGISSLALDNTPIESAIVTKYGPSGQTFIDNTRFCLNMYNLASGTGQLIKLTTSYSSAKSFWATNKTQIKNENIIAQNEFEQFDNFLNEAKLAQQIARHPNWVEVTNIATKVENRINHVDGIILETNGFTGCHSQNALNNFLISHPGYTGGFKNINGNAVTLIDNAVTEAYPWVRDVNGNLLTKINGAQANINGAQYGKASFFPKNWDRARIKLEVEHAIDYNHGLVTGNTYKGYSIDGSVEIWFYYNPSNGSIISYFPKL